MRIINKYQEGNKARRVNFTKWYDLEKKKKGTKVRPFNGDVLTQFEDSLIANNFSEPLRLALLATAHLEMGKAGAASRGIGGNGIIGLSSGRMPLKYLNNTGDLIHYIILDVQKRTNDNWTSGGKGGPYIKTAKEGFQKFYNATTPYDATVLLNKAYIRPAALSDWDVRGLVAKDMSTFLFKKGNKIHIKKANRGKFTSYCGGTVTNECIQRGKNSPNPAIRKRANFAANARKWKHAHGGLLGYYQEGGTVNEYANTLNPYWQKMAKIFNIKNDDEFEDFVYNHPSISNFQSLWESNIEPDTKQGNNFPLNYYYNEVSSRFPGKTFQTLNLAFGDSWKQKTPSELTDDEWRQFARLDSINAAEFHKKNPYAPYFL